MYTKNKTREGELPKLNKHKLSNEERKISSPVNREDEFSSMDPSLVKDLLRSEESYENRNNHMLSNRDNEENHEDQFYNNKFSDEIISIEDEEVEMYDNDNKINDNEEIDENLNDYNEDNPIQLKNTKKEKYDADLMERISEVEEDDKQPTIFDKINIEIMKDEYKLNERKFDEIMKQNINSKNVKEYFSPTLYNTENQQSFKYKPEINKKSQFMVNQQRNKSSDSVGASQRSKTPIQLELYNDAAKRKEKLKKIEYNNMMAIVLNASKTKISNNSHKIAITKVEKMIDNSVVKFEKDKKLSFINVGEVLTDLKIFREILQDNQDKKDKKHQSYKDIKMELNNIKEREKRKKSEVDFYEQIWISLNPENRDFIKTEIFSEFLKILFSPVASSAKEISSILKQFLMAAFFLNSNPEEDKSFVSPITEKVIPEDDIWPLDQLVREFLKLKENILAYQNIHNTSKKLLEDMEKIKKERKYVPEINEKKYKSRSTFFEERLPVLLEREKLRRHALVEMKKESDQSMLKECTFKPQINKRSSNVAKQEDASDTSMNSSQVVYDKLYHVHKDKQIKREKEIVSQKSIREEKELDGCTFQPEFISQKSFVKSITSQEKPKGYEQSVDRMRKGILENIKKKFLLKKIPIGENYEKIKRANIKPFNITDLKKKEENNEEKEDAKEVNDDYFSIQITIPSGKERTLRVHKDDDPYEVSENFCKVYGMKEEIKQRLAKTILQFMNLYLIKTNEKSQFNEHLSSSNNPQNNYSGNNFNLDEL